MLHHPIRRPAPAHRALCFAAMLFLNSSVALAAKVTVTIVSEPTGANIDWNGRFIGTTPFSAEVEDYFVKAPRFLWSNFLGESITLRLWKEGYLAKSVEITSGPYVWTNLNNTARKIYYVVNVPNVRVLLERDPRTAPPPPPVPATSSTVEGPVTATGSGFIISSGHVATNFHVVRDSERLEVRIPGRSELLPAEVVVKDAGNDLAIVRVAGLPAPPTPIAFADASAVRVGQDAFTLGFPLGTLMGSTVRLSTGTIDSLFGLDDDPRVYQISNPVQPGNSGGPLFNKDGQLIGIVVAQLDAKVLYEAVGVIPQNVNFAVKATFLKNLVDSLGSGMPSPSQVTPLRNLPRDAQVEALTPAVVEVVNHRASPVRPNRSQVRSAESQQPSIEGLNEGQVRALLGPPSTFSQSGNMVVWYYDTPTGTLRVYFVGGRASLRRP